MCDVTADTGREVHLLGLARRGTTLDVPDGCLCIPVPGCVLPDGLATPLERPEGLFDDAVSRYTAMLDDYAAAFAHRRAWLHCQNFLVKRHRSKVFRYMFVLEASERYGEQPVVFHCDDYHLFLATREIPGLTVEFHGTASEVSRKLTTVGGLLTASLKLFRREMVKLFRRYFAERRIDNPPAAPSSSDCLILTHDTYFPWDRDSDKPDRIWGPLDKALHADFGVVHRVNADNVRFARQHGAPSILLMDSFGKLLRSMAFRIKSWWYFFWLMTCRRRPRSVLDHSRYFGVFLFEDAVLNGPHWHEYMVATKDFLRRNPRYRHVIVQGEFHCSGRVGCLAAHDLGRRAYSYALSIHYNAHLQIRLTRQEKALFDMPDACLVWSRRTMQLMHDYSEVLPRTCIVGQCRLVDGEMRRQDHPAIVGLMESTADSPSLFEYVTDNALELRDFSFYLKAHPTRHTAYDALNLDGLPVDITLCREVEPKAFFDQVDTLVVGATTAGVEALKLGIPVVVVRESVSWGMTTLLRHAPRRGVYMAETARDVAEGIRYFREHDIAPEAMAEEYDFYVGAFHPDRIRRLMDFVDRPKR